ncbi:hypothetical protein [Pseudomonas viridiflava]|uniref:hypothetical protein n=1 Tax=Pseudomonas viridiflava TaxID=33069 RepID=UPI000F04551D|nr:hypothetical protein [Pseudomonas viridiflava]
MDVNKQSTPVDEPVSALAAEILEDIRHQVHNTGIDFAEGNGKQLINEIFDLAQGNLERYLSGCNSESWLLEAYKQLFMWTAVYRGMPNQSFLSPKELGPVGRFGWRFVIEYLVSKKQADVPQRRKPSFEDVKKVFTVLSVMANAAEWSNALHFFPDVYEKISFDLSTPYGILLPILSEESNSRLSERSQYMRATDGNCWSILTDGRISLDENIIKAKLSNAILKAKGFSLEQIDKIIDTLLQKVLTSGFVLIIPGEYLIAWISDESGISAPTVAKVLDFMLLSTVQFGDDQAKFLDKKDPARMINFAGIKITDLKFLTSIYPKQSVSKSHIKNSSWHVIVNIFLVGEWYDILKHRCATGQRLDLKRDTSLNLALEAIEQYQRKNIFESVVTDIFLRAGHTSIQGIRKLAMGEGRPMLLPCGEIDVLAFDIRTNILYVVECKASTPATDIRGQFQQYKDHFSQKNYDKKFKLKIRWVTENLKVISDKKELHMKQAKISETRVVPLLVTRYPSIVKFYSTEYRVLTYAELYQELVCSNTKSQDQSNPLHC